jgi:hypothetical protein
VAVEYNNEHKPFRFFELVLPPLTKSTIFFEVMFGAVQNLGSLQLSSGVLPVSRAANNEIAIAQTVFSTLFMLFMVYVSPGQAFMNDLGAVMDDYCINLFRRIQQHEIIEPAIEISAKTKMKVRLAQGFLILFLLNNLYTEIINDYQQTISLNDRINAQRDSIMPAWMVYICSMIEFGLNQLNDPIMLFSEMLMGFTLIDVYFRHQNKPLAKVVIEQMDEKQDNKTVTGLHKFGKFASPVDPSNSDSGYGTFTQPLLSSPRH